MVVIDRDRAVVESLRAQGRAAVLGDAAEAMTLVQAHIARAQWLVVALSDVRGVPPMLDLARQLNADLRCVVLAHTDEEAGWLRAAGVSDVLRSQTALAQALAGAVHAGPSAGQAPHMGPRLCLNERRRQGCFAARANRPACRTSPPPRSARPRPPGAPRFATVSGHKPISSTLLMTRSKVICVLPMLANPPCQMPK